ncbi:MAG TPA: ATPase [Bacilli bacterium]|nr:ATPase [Bacilli bacterium]
MLNDINRDNNEGGMKVAVNDMVEIISSSNPEIYGKIGEVLEIMESREGVELRVETIDGMEFWIDSEDVVLY